jgi:ankyrin repeat protein
MYAARDGYTEIVKLLADHGADINYRDPKDGMSPIALARKQARTDTVQYLQSKDAR